MAIKLEIQPYCENCMIFDADVERPTKLYGNDLPVHQTATVVRCSRRNTCAGIMRYLEKELQKRDARDRFAVFLDYTTPTYDRQWFHTLIADKCQQLLNGTLGTNRLMLSIAPQHGHVSIGGEPQ